MNCTVPPVLPKSYELLATPAAAAADILLLFGTDPDRNRVTWETPAVKQFPTVKSH
jgi:hypothetical protein